MPTPCAASGDHANLIVGTEAEFGADLLARWEQRLAVGDGNTAPFRWATSRCAGGGIAAVRYPEADIAAIMSEQ